jgi:hypothetical protein
MILYTQIFHILWCRTDCYLPIFPRNPIRAKEKKNQEEGRGQTRGGQKTGGDRPNLEPSKVPHGHPQHAPLWLPWMWVAHPTPPPPHLPAPRRESRMLRHQTSPPTAGRSATATPPRGPHRKDHLTPGPGRPAFSALSPLSPAEIQG